MAEEFLARWKKKSSRRFLGTNELLKSDERSGGDVRASSERDVCGRSEHRDECFGRGGIIVLSPADSKTARRMHKCCFFRRNAPKQFKAYPTPGNGSLRSLSISNNFGPGRTRRSTNANRLRVQRGGAVNEVQFFFQTFSYTDSIQNSGGTAASTSNYGRDGRMGHRFILPQSRSRFFRDTTPLMSHSWLSRPRRPGLSSQSPAVAH
jgi:hypothetical protein